MLLYINVFLNDGKENLTPRLTTCIIMTNNIIYIKASLFWNDWYSAIDLKIYPFLIQQCLIGCTCPFFLPMYILTLILFSFCTFRYSNYFQCPCAVGEDDNVICKWWTNIIWCPCVLGPSSFRSLYVIYIHFFLWV